ncbi:MAG: S-layer homology domain-containing protein, partial [Clostridia bacterium]|nr:S-layer homology domain-containing protein [Clostridia bacterium]
TWTDGIEFPAISNAMSEEEMLEIMDEKMEFCLTYLPGEKEHRLAYTFLNASNENFDPFTGKLLNYDGTEVAKTYLPEYTDIHGHWAEDIILTLLDNGYYFPENEFAPEQVVTKKEFLQFFKMIGNDTDEELNELIAKIEGVESGKSDCNAPLTKEVAAGYLMYRLGYQKVAELDHIFVYPFQDDFDGNSKWKGDISLCAGFGIFHGDGNQNFHPEKQLNRAETASILYHFLKTQG